MNVLAKIIFPYNKEKIVLDIPDNNLISILDENTIPAVQNPEEAIIEAMANPIGSKSLIEIAAHKNASNAVIVVNDVTRPTPYKFMLPPLLAELNNAGITNENITLVVATGIHRPNTAEENNATFTSDIITRVNVINHDPDANLVNIGKLADGKDLMINATVANADLVITTGLINLHYFAGYSGGRKSILPGVVSRNLITHNHSRMNEAGSKSGSVKNNPVHHIMLEAARKVGVDFILNVVTNNHKEIVAVVAGDVETAWLKGVDICRKMSTVSISQLADVVIASAGGYPKDINIYQAQKGLEHATQACRSGGTVVLLAACTEGYGEDTFQRWMEEAATWQDIIRHFEREFELGGHKAFALARALHDKNIILLSDLPDNIIETMKMQKVSSSGEILSILNKLHGGNWKAFVMPNASNVLPILND